MLTYKCYHITEVNSNGISILRQIRVEVRDMGVPPKSSFTVVEIAVQRNLNKPTFDNTQYTHKIQETQQLGEGLLSVTAKDTDRWVSISMYTISSAR